MPSSPQTPRHSRHSSIITSGESPNSDGPNPRRHSKNSAQSPSTPNHFDRSGSIGIDVFSSGGVPAPSNGLGNLADELADAWSGDEEGEEGSDDDDSEGGANTSSLDFQKKNQQATRDSGVDVNSSPSYPTTQKKMRDAPPRMLNDNDKDIKHPNLSPPMPSARSNQSSNGHRRHQSEYDGSDYGGDSDMDSPGELTPSLVARMDMIESLVRRGTEENGGSTDGVVGRVIEGLRDLGGQGGVEGNATRLITAHTALSTHLIHQTRLLHTLSYPLISPLAAPFVSPDLASTLLPLLTPLFDSLPRPSTQSLHSLTSLHTLTTDLIQTLNYLSDTLHMSRQTTTSANRRLRSARELVAEMRREQEAREEGERWIKRGNWGERLMNRECKSECEGVVGGFEEVCRGWRERLVAQAGLGVEGVAVAVAV